MMQIEVAILFIWNSTYKIQKLKHNKQAKRRQTETIKLYYSYVLHHQVHAVKSVKVAMYSCSVHNNNNIIIIIITTTYMAQ